MIMDFEVVSPKNKSELLNVINDNLDGNFRISAGFTDLYNQLKKSGSEGVTIINLTQLNEPELKSIHIGDSEIRIGTLVTAADIVDHAFIKVNFPVLHMAASKLASLQIRNVATIGGNICNVSPSGDMTAAMITLQAVCHVIDSEGNERSEPLISFIRGLKKTSLEKNEIIQYVTIPKNIHSKIYSGYEKVGARKSMEIAIVSLGYHFQLNDEGIIQEAGISCGAVAPVIPFATDACSFLIGKKLDELSDADKNTFADLVVAYANPISDIRASAWYRTEVLKNLACAILP